MRTKEELNDYRYFPDPDLSPLEVSETWLNELKQSMPTLPRELHQKFVSVYKLPAYDAQVLTESKEMAIYFEAICEHTKNFKAASNWMMGPVKSYLNDSNLESNELPIKASALADVITLVDAGKLNFTVAAQKLFPELLKNPTTPPLELAQKLNLIQDSNADSILPVVEQIIKEFPLKVEEYKKGKTAIITMFMGEVMKRTKGKADPKLATELLIKKLS
jgi:aspartyl-tRNA(Asn)/glutamyl-tRNA(Gln) amidotransferase subunit B